MAYYLDPERQKETSSLDLDSIVEAACSKKEQNNGTTSLLEGPVLRQCLPDDVVQMRNLYKKVFPSYPFPIDDPEYIRKTMRDNIVYFGIEKGNELIALSSTEMDTISKNVEMTDFATLPEFRGNGLAGLLLISMEQEMRLRGIYTAYTIARAVSPAMNITFGKAGYSYGGRLVNNTNISGQIESMNVWHKKLHEHVLF